MHLRIRLIGLTAAALVLTGAAQAAEDSPEKNADGTVVFRHVLDNSPIAFEYRKDQEITPQVAEFHKTGENPYRGDEEAMAEGKKLYAKLCQACHLKDGTGRIGPNLTDTEWRYERVATDVGKFEIIYAGGAGAMQPFGRRIDQDDILKAMAYLDTFQKPGE